MNIIAILGSLLGVAGLGYLYQRSRANKAETQLMTKDTEIKSNKIDNEISNNETKLKENSDKIEKVENSNEGGSYWNKRFPKKDQ